MRIVFRADASLTIGAGHVMRCLTLANKLRQSGADCLFVCRDHEGNLSSVIEANGFHCELLVSQVCLSELQEKPEPLVGHTEWLGVSWQQDAQQFIEALNGQVADWLVVDHYAIDALWEQRVAGCSDKLMCIDDLADRPHHEPAILLDQTLGRGSSSYNGLVSSETDLLLGLKYCLLRDEFSEYREKVSERINTGSGKRRIFLNMGGVDKTNVTEAVLQALASQSNFNIKVDVVVGKTNPNIARLQTVVSNMPFACEMHVNSCQIARLMSESDFAIGAAGATSWERCCLGLPTISVVLAENQRFASRQLQDEGVVISLGQEELAERLGSALDELTNRLPNMSRRCMELLDGRGAARVAEKMIGSSNDFRK